MFKDVEIFDVAHHADQLRDIQTQVDNDTTRHVFIKQYLFCFVKQVTTIRYTNKERHADRDRVLIAQLCDRWDEIFFGYARLTAAAFEYSAERRFVVEIPHKESKAADVAVKVANTVFGVLLGKLLEYKKTTFGDIAAVYNDMDKLPQNVRELVVKLGAFNLGFIDIIFKQVNYYVKFNTENANKLRELYNITDFGDAQPFAPVGKVAKVFLALNTLYAKASTSTSTSTSNQPAQTEPASETTATAGGWGNVGNFSNKPADEPQTAEPQTATATADGWGNVGAFGGGDEANEKASSSDEKDEAQTDHQQPAEMIKNAVKNADFTEILPAVARSTDAATAQFIDALSIHEFRHTKGAKAEIQFILNIAAPDCLRRIERGEIKSPSDYRIYNSPRDILRMMNEPVSTPAARDIEAAIIELHEKPLKYTRHVKDGGKTTIVVDSFQVITHIHTENGKIVWYQFAPSIVTAGHVVNKAFKQYRDVKEIFATGKYVLSADISDADIVANHILSSVKAGEPVYWRRIFEDFTFADTNTSRVQRRILDSIDRHGYDHKKVNKLCFVFTPKQGTAAADAAKTAELAKATAVELAKIKKRTTNRKQKTAAKTAAKKTASRTTSRAKKQ